MKSSQDCKLPMALTKKFAAVVKALPKTARRRHYVEKMIEILEAAKERDSVSVANDNVSVKASDAGDVEKVYNLSQRNVHRKKAKISAVTVDDDVTEIDDFAEVSNSQKESLAVALAPIDSDMVDAQSDGFENNLDNESTIAVPIVQKETRLRTILNECQALLDSYNANADDQSETRELKATSDVIDVYRKNCLTFSRSNLEFKKSLTQLYAFILKKERETGKDVKALREEIYASFPQGTVPYRTFLYHVKLGSLCYRLHEIHPSFIGLTLSPVFDLKQSIVDELIKSVQKFKDSYKHVGMEEIERTVVGPEPSTILRYNAKCIDDDGLALERVECLRADHLESVSTMAMLSDCVMNYWLNEMQLEFQFSFISADAYDQVKKKHPNNLAEIAKASAGIFRGNPPSLGKPTFCPVVESSHWWLLVFITNPNSRSFYTVALNSINGYHDNVKHSANLMGNFFEYYTGWTNQLVFTTAAVPMQRNSVDCGIHTLLAIRELQDVEAYDAMRDNKTLSIDEGLIHGYRKTIMDAMESDVQVYASDQLIQ